MKKGLFILMFSFVLVACGNNDNTELNNDPMPNDDATNTEQNDMDNANDDNSNDGNMNDDSANDNTSTDGTTDTASSDQEYFKEKMETLNFNDFQVEIKYADRKEYEAEVDLNNDGTYDVEVEDDINGVKLKARDAFEELFPRLEKLDLTNDSEKQEVFKQILNAFDLSDDYIEFDIEFQFNDGKQLEYEEEK